MYEPLGFTLTPDQIVQYKSSLIQFRTYSQTLDFAAIGAVLGSIAIGLSTTQGKIAMSAWIGGVFGLLVGAISWAAVSCAADERPQNGIEYFEIHIRPMFAKHCYQCYSKRAKELEGGLLLDSRVGWMESGESGPVRGSWRRGR